MLDNIPLHVLHVDLQKQKSRFLGFLFKKCGEKRPLLIQWETKMCHHMFHVAHAVA